MNGSKYESEKPVVENPTEARQAERRFGLRILVVSICLVVVGFVAVYFLVGLFNPTTPPAATESSPPAIETEPPPNVPPAGNDLTVTTPTPEVPPRD